jgi:glycine/D-amino acid oxidase-like deaminating enzyme
MAAVPTRAPAAGGDALRIGPVFWLQQALAEDGGAACPALAGTVRADVCVVGGGFTGLWTALEVAELAPDAKVVVLEGQGCGFGASGRNGGWATGWHDELHELVERFGPEQGVFLAEQSTRAIDRIEEVAGAEGIDCHLRRAGALWAAAAPAQADAFGPVLEAVRAHGRDAFLQSVDGPELRRRTGSPILLEGLLHTDAAALQPALLARGLRRLALRRGIEIFEGTPMVDLERTRPAAVVTPAGRVEAESVVLATGAWAARVRELRRAIVPIGSHIVLTEPIPDRIAELGWTGGELLGDTRLLVHYAQVTRDGRIAFGRGGGAIGAFGRVRPSHVVDPRTVEVVAASLRRWFPQLADVRLTHAWGGAVDRAPGHLPFVGDLGDHGNIHYGVGFSGNGVAPSAFVGRILGRLALGVRDELTTCALVTGPPGYLPPEPFRSLGGVVIRDAVRRAEAAEERGARPGRVAAALRRGLWFTMPRAVEPRLWRRR